MKRTAMPERMVLGALILALGILVGCSDKNPMGGHHDGDGEGDDLPDTITDGRDGQDTENPEDPKNPEDPNNDRGGISIDNWNFNGVDPSLPRLELVPRDGDSEQTVALRLMPIIGTLQTKVLGAKVMVDRIIVESEYNLGLNPILDQQNMALEINLLDESPVLLANIPIIEEKSVLVRVFFRGEGELALKEHHFGVPSLTNLGHSTFPIVNMSIVKIRIRSMKDAAHRGVDMEIMMPDSLSGLENLIPPVVFTPKGDYIY